MLTSQLVWLWPSCRHEPVLLSARDREDIRLAAANQVTYVSVPFVRTAADVLEVRRGGGWGMLGRGGSASWGCADLCGCADVALPLLTMPHVPPQRCRKIGRLHGLSLTLAAASASCCRCRCRCCCRAAAAAAAAAVVDCCCCCRAVSPRQIRELLDSQGGPMVKIVAQIDTPSAIRNYHELLRVADAIMVSRTNLGMVIKPEKV